MHKHKEAHHMKKESHSEGHHDGHHDSKKSHAKKSHKHSGTALKAKIARG